MGVEKSQGMRTNINYGHSVKEPTSEASWGLPMGKHAIEYTYNTWNVVTWPHHTLCRWLYNAGYANRKCTMANRKMATIGR